MQSVEFRVLEVGIPKDSSMCLMQAGILVASPTNSTEWSLDLSTPKNQKVLMTWIQNI